VDCHQTDAAQQTTRRAAGERPSCSQWYLQDLAIRSTATRYDKLAANYLAFVQLAAASPKYHLGEQLCL
jgi:transposase